MILNGATAGRVVRRATGDTGAGREILNIAKGSASQFRSRFLSASGELIGRAIPWNKGELPGFAEPDGRCPANRRRRIAPLGLLKSSHSTQ